MHSHAACCTEYVQLSCNVMQHFYSSTLTYEHFLTTHVKYLQILVDKCETFESIFYG